MKPVAVIPTLCTLGNAFCGFLAIAKGADAVASLTLSEGPLQAAQVDRFYGLMSTACWLVFLAMVFDALDGRIARMTQQTSDFGAMLDSLTDMLTFGAAPALLLKFLFESTRRIQELPAVAPKVVLLLTVLYVCCAALRLARFTLESDEEASSHDFFAGLPTPAAAGFLCASMLFYCHTPDTMAGVELSEGFRGHFLSALLLATAALGLLMISKIPYTHLVNRYMRGRKPYTYVVQIVFVLFLLAIFETWALFLGFLLYVTLCPALHRWDRLRHARRARSRSPGGTGG